MECWHLVLSSTDRMPLFGTEARRRAAVRRLFSLMRERLVLFSFADDHGHLAVFAPGAAIPRLGASLMRSMQPLLASPVGPPHPTRVESRSHLLRLIPYFLRQPQHHGLPTHPALWSGSCFQDLAGARCLGVPLRLWDLLPRLRPVSLLEHVGLPADALQPASDPMVRSVGAASLVRAAAAAAGAAPDLLGRSPSVLRARRAAVRLADRVGLARSELAWALAVTPRALRRIAARAISEELTRAVRLQLTIERHCAEGAGWTGTGGPVSRAKLAR